MAPRYMEITKSKFAWFQFQNALSIAGFRANVTVTMDADRNYIVTVDEVDVYQLGVATNFYGWVPTSITPYQNQPSKGFITVNVKGRTTWGLSDPGGTQGTYTQQENKDVVIDFT